MRANEDRVFAQGSRDQGLPTRERALDLLPRGHPCRLLKFDRYMVEVAKAVERLPLRVNSNNLVAGCLAWRSHNLYASAQIAVAVNEFQEPVAVQDTKRVTFCRVGVMQRLLERGFVPVRSAEIIMCIGERRLVGAVA